MRHLSKISATAIAIALATVVLGGCSYTTQRAPGLGLEGLRMEQLCRQDYVVLETIAGKGSVTTVFGFKLGDNQFGQRIGPYP